MTDKIGFTFNVKTKTSARPMDADRAKSILWDNANNIALNIAKLQKLGELPTGAIVAYVHPGHVTLHNETDNTVIATSDFDADKRDKVGL